MFLWPASPWHHSCHKAKDRQVTRILLLWLLLGWKHWKIGKKYFSGLSLCELRIPHSLAKGNVHQAKDNEKEPQIVKNASKNIFSYGNLHQSWSHFRPFVHPFPDVHLTVGHFHCSRDPTQTLQSHTNAARGAAAIPPNLGTCNRHLCADLSLFLLKTRLSIYPWKDWQQHSCLLQNSHHFTTIISTPRLYSLKVVQGQRQHQGRHWSDPSLMQKSSQLPGKAQTSSRERINAPTTGI